MTLRSKVVAALAIILLVLPTAALAACLSHGQAIGQHATDCQMMSQHLGLASIRKALPDAACCELSSGKSAPASVVQAPSTAADLVTPASIVSTVDAPSLEAEASSIGPAVRPSGPALQAILCVFLI
jgi:hypothetical protein